MRVTIPDLVGYEASDDGSIWSTKRHDGIESPLATLESRGYLYVRVCVNGKRIKKAVHSLVARAFYGLPEHGQQVRHLNGIRSDNRKDNLCWGSARENIDDRARHGTTAVGDRNGMRLHPERASRKFGTDNRKTKLTDDQVREVLAQSANGECQRTIAARFGICQQTVSDIVRGRRRKEIARAVKEATETPCPSQGHGEAADRVQWIGG